MDATSSAEVQEAARRAMVKWVAAIADRVKNPIAGVVAALAIVEDRLAQDGRKDDEVDDALARMRARLLQLDAYVSELIAFAQPAVVQPTSLAVGELLADVTADVRRAMPADATLTLEVAPGTASLRADRVKLRLALLALLENAMQAVPPTVPIQVVLQAATVSERTRLTIEDNGPGIGADAAESLMQPFTSTKEAGTGLGLALARKIVEAHGGGMRIERSSRLGGARIVLELPA